MGLPIPDFIPKSSSALCIFSSSPCRVCPAVSAVPSAFSMMPEMNPGRRRQFGVRDHEGHKVGEYIDVW